MTKILTCQQERHHKNCKEEEEKKKLEALLESKEFAKPSQEEVDQYIEE